MLVIRRGSRYRPRQLSLKQPTSAAFASLAPLRAGKRSAATPRHEVADYEEAMLHAKQRSTNPKGLICA